MGFPCLRCESYQQQINFEQAGFPSRVCRLLGCQRLLICTKTSSLSSASTSSTSNNTSTGAGVQLVIVKVLALLVVDFFFIELELQDHLNFSGLGGLSALAGENDPRSPQLPISATPISHISHSHVSNQVWTSLLPPRGGIQPRLARGHIIFGDQLGFRGQVATTPT